VRDFLIFIFPFFCWKFSFTVFPHSAHSLHFPVFFFHFIFFCFFLFPFVLPAGFFLLLSFIRCVCVYISTTTTTTTTKREGDCMCARARMPRPPRSRGVSEGLKQRQRRYPARSLSLASRHSTPTTTRSLAVFCDYICWEKKKSSFHSSSIFIPFWLRFFF
jgi:hypothetical protein